MHKPFWIIVATVVAFSLSTTLFAQQKSLRDKLVGSWELISVAQDYDEDSGKSGVVKGLFGAYYFGPNGRAMFIAIGGEPPANPSRGVVAWFGSYTTDDATSSYTYVAEKASIPALDGQPVTMHVTWSGDDEFTARAPPVKTHQGTFTPTLVFKRVN